MYSHSADVSIEWGRDMQFTTKAIHGFTHTGRERHPFAPGPELLTCWLLQVLNSHRRTLVLGAACAGLLAPALRAAPITEGNEFVQLEKLSERVKLAYWIGMDRRCNLTAIRTTKGLVIIDTEMSPRIMAPIKERLEGAFGRSNWVYVINTHAHDNHAGGNALFKGAVVAGHENLAKDMQWIVQGQKESDRKNRQIERAEAFMKNLRSSLPEAARRSTSEIRMVQGELKFWELYTKDLREGYQLVQPSLTFSEQRTLDLGDVHLELIFFGKGHSLSDTLVYVPEENLLVTGGVVYQRAQFPEIGEESHLEDVRRYLSVLDRFLKPEVKIAHVIPSHSPPLVKQDMAPVRDYYQRMLSGVRLAQQQGLTLDQAQLRLGASLFPAFRQPPAGSWSYGMHERNLRNLWRILQEKN